MTQYTIRSDHASVIAIDQHARSVTMQGIDFTTSEVRTKRLVNCPAAADMVEWASSWSSPPMRFVYESGPCGFQLARDIRALGHDCDIIAVSSIARSPEDKALKDDRRDAERLLEQVTSPRSKCKVVWIPDEECEAGRDLCRAYRDVVLSEKRYKLQLSGFLMRHGHVWNRKSPSGRLLGTWTREYLKWVRSIEFADEAANETLKLYLVAATEEIERAKEVEARCKALAKSERFKPYVDALTRLKGVEPVTAITFVVTVGDFERFRNGRSVSAYFGLTPRRSDSGEKTGRNGPITKAGDSTCRHAVIESLAAIPNFNARKKALKRGQVVSAEVEAEAVKCNARNRKRYSDLVGAGCKPNVAKTAVASELVREMWVLGRMVQRELADR